MKGYIIVLFLVFLIYSVSADWKEDLLKQYTSTMANRINDKKELAEHVQQRRGVGVECITTQNDQLGRLLSVYPKRIRNCMNESADQVSSKRCCEREQSYTFGRVEHILQEAMDCVSDMIILT